MPPKTPVVLRPFTAADLPAALGLSTAVHWPHRAQDWAMTLGLSEGIVAQAGDRIVGTALMTPHGTDAATCNMIILEESLRGQGHGRRLMEAVLALAGARECRLTATADGLPLYARLGFAITGEVRQHQGIATGGAPLAGLRPARPDDLPGILALDRAATGMDRPALMAALMAQDALQVLGPPGAAVAFLALRAFGLGQVVGPVVAPDAATAAQLCAAAAHQTRGRHLRADLPQTGAALAPVLTALGLAQVGGGTAMTRPGTTALPPIGATLFALTSQALL